jgi:hypothetical protein
MTQEPKPSGTPETTPAAQADAFAPGSTANKAFWLGMGVGSAALVAALMYARRPKRRT